MFSQDNIKAHLASLHEILPSGSSSGHQEKILFSLGKTPVTIAGLVDFFLIIFLGILVRRAVVKALTVKAERESSVQSRNLILLGSKLSGTIVLFLTGLLALDNIGVKLTSVEGVLGMVGLGFGIGLQSVAANIIALGVILAEKSVQPGDIIEIDGIVGTVKEIRPRSTVIMSTDNIAVIVPNGHFISNKVINWSHLESKIRAHIKVGVGMTQKDLDSAVRIMKEVAINHPMVLQDPPPDVWFLSFGESTYDLDLVFWMKDATVRYQVTSDLGFSLSKAFYDAGVSIPYPIRTLFVNDPVGAPAQKFPVKG
jgi:small-conductance mechanosensitive channel